jgi:hypothetical protein
VLRQMSLQAARCDNVQQNNDSDRRLLNSGQTSHTMPAYMVITSETVSSSSAWATDRPTDLLQRANRLPHDRQIQEAMYI